jgi:hypothetical protein
MKNFLARSKWWLIMFVGGIAMMQSGMDVGREELGMALSGAALVLVATIGLSWTALTTKKKEKDDG